MTRKSTFVLLSCAALTLGGCDAATNLAAAALGANLPGGVANLLPVMVKGKVFGTVDQVAIVAGGAGNIVAGGAGNIVAGGAGNATGDAGSFQPSFGLLARSDESGVKDAQVILTALNDANNTAKATTDSSGNFNLEVKGNTTYKITVPVKGGGTLTGLALARAAVLRVELDAAHHMAVGALLAGSTPSHFDAAKFEELLVACRLAMESVSRTPTMNSLSDAKAQWDKLATNELKLKLKAVTESNTDDQSEDN